ncbi:unnamed protein product [Brassicogethes aeneus]|uniref:Uncharacterized protein n=1 Tax=Brassicogethes aeneus TaxID=1431903 RepID=A0A9P0B4G4_BRAAE|nr:unnamed protein product [Brassicogethes aeneus]
MSTPGNKNPYVTGGINKNLLTPCRPLGLSRKRKTPASGVKTPLLNSPALISTPKAENSYTENGTPLVSTRNKVNNVTDSGSKAKKKKISKRLAMDVENNEDDVNKGVEQKIDPESDDDLPLVKAKTKKEDMSKNHVKTTIETTKEIKPYDKNKKDPAKAIETKQTDDIPLVKAKPKKKPVKTIETTKEIKPKVDKTKIYNENKIDILKLKETNEEMQQKEVIKPTCHNKTSNIVQEIQNKYDSDDLPLKIKIKLDNDVNKIKIIKNENIQKMDTESSSDDIPINIKRKIKKDIEKACVNSDSDNDVNKIKIIKNENIQKMDTETSSDDIPIFIKRKIKKDIEKACVNSDSDNESLLSIKKQEKNVINSDLSPKTVNKHKPKPKKYISSDSEDDFQVNSKSTQKTYSRIKVKADIHQESKTKFKKVDSVESDIQKLQEIEKNMTCKVHLELLSGSHIKSLLPVGQDNVITSTQVDSDKVQSFDKVINKHKPLIILQKNYNEDDDFACSPNDDKFDKGDTLKKIKYLELSNKGKKEKLAKLKQAEVYKNLHNVGELENLTKIWTNGCKLALEDLLKQLQAHGPMDMPMLLRKLNIPEKISNKFKFSSESN